MTLAIEFRLARTDDGAVSQYLLVPLEMGFHDGVSISRFPLPSKRHHGVMVKRTIFDNERRHWRLAFLLQNQVMSDT